MKKAIEVYKNIKTSEDLKRNKLTLAEYRDLGYTLQSVIDIGKGTTILKSVSEWGIKHGLKVFEESECFILSK